MHPTTFYNNSIKKLGCISVISFSMCLGLSATSALALEKVGVAAILGTGATANNPENNTPRTLKTGDAIYLHDNITLDTKTKAQIIFVDRSTLSLQPESNMKVDTYTFNADSQNGNMQLSTVKGAFRLVGGALTKKQPVKIKTPVATIGIRGGIVDSFVDANGATDSVFLYGEEMTLTNQQGVTATTTEFGTGFNLSTPQATPAALPASAIRSRMQQNAPATSSSTSTGNAGTGNTSATSTASASGTSAPATPSSTASTGTAPAGNTNNPTTSPNFSAATSPAMATTFTISVTDVVDNSQVMSDTKNTIIQNEQRKNDEQNQKLNPKTPTDTATIPPITTITPPPLPTAVLPEADETTPNNRPPLVDNNNNTRTIAPVAPPITVETFQNSGHRISGATSSAITTLNIPKNLVNNSTVEVDIGDTTTVPLPWLKNSSTNVAMGGYTGVGVGSSDGSMQYYKIRDAAGTEKIIIYGQRYKDFQKNKSVGSSNFHNSSKTKTITKSSAEGRENFTLYAALPGLQANSTLTLEENPLLSGIVNSNLQLNNLTLTEKPFIIDWNKNRALHVVGDFKTNKLNVVAGYLNNMSSFTQMGYEKATINTEINADNTDTTYEHYVNNDQIIEGIHARHGTNVTPLMRLDDATSQQYYTNAQLTSNRQAEETKNYGFGAGIVTKNTSGGATTTKVYTSNGYNSSTYLRTQGANASTNSSIKLYAEGISNSSTNVALSASGKNTYVNDKYHAVINGNLAVVSSGALENAPQCTNCQYTNWGVWAGEKTDSSGTTHTVNMLPYVAGQITQNIPAFDASYSNVNYSGVAVANAYDGTNISNKTGTMTANVDLHDRKVKSLNINLDGGIKLGINTSANINPSGNATFNGDITGTQGATNLSGKYYGAMFGDNAEEIGGNFHAKATTEGNNTAVGGIFLGARPTDTTDTTQ